MEFDQYDQADTYYIVHINDQGEVDATCRVSPTSKPYMIGDHYSDFVEKIPLPNCDEIWEISRFCASEDIRKASKGRITGQLIAAAIEFGLMKNIKNYVALVSDYLIPIIKRFGGWDPQTLGSKRPTPDDISYSVIYTVCPEMLEQVKKKKGIQGDTLITDKKNIHSPLSSQGKNMQQSNNTTFVPSQIVKPIDPQIEMERTLSYLEAIAFARDYQPIMAGLRFTRLILECEKDSSSEIQKLKKDALQSLDEIYRKLKNQLEKIYVIHNQ